MKNLHERLLSEVSKVVIGQEEPLSQILCAVMIGGHVLLEGVPGVGKTLLAQTLAKALGIDFSRVQFTPDMLPSDLTGTMTLRGGELAFRPGPIFTSVLLADEINRTPPKTQAALLEAMAERQVTVDGHTHPLADPFLVLATQNPIDYEGTYPLPEAQLDRFLMKVELGYPSAEQERAVLALDRRGLLPSGLDHVQQVTNAAELLQTRTEVDSISVSGEVADYAVALVRRTRELPSVELGASPRACVHLVGAAKATAGLGGRTFVTPDDVAAVAPAVLRHRLLMTPESELERYGPEQAIETVLIDVPVPR